MKNKLKISDPQKTIKTNKKRVTIQIPMKKKTVLTVVCLIGMSIPIYSQSWFDGYYDYTVLYNHAELLQLTSYEKRIFLSKIEQAISKRSDKIFLETRGINDVLESSKITNKKSQNTRRFSDVSMALYDTKKKEID